MPLFRTDSVVLCYANLQLAKQWWIVNFDCKPAKVPSNWDDPLPSDIALKLPGDAEPAISLSDCADVQSARLARANEHPILFCNNLKKAHAYLLDKGTAPGPIQDAGGTQFFEIRDGEGNIIEICNEP